MAQPGRPSAGDMTGRQKQQLNKEAREVQAERSAEISMMDASESEADRNGVFDAQSGARLNSPAATQTAVMVDEPPAAAGFPQTGDGPPVEPILSGQEDPEVVAPIIAAKKTFNAPPVQVVRSSMVTVRVDQDIDDMTYGMHNGEPNNYTFKEGLQYRIPLPVAEHLNDRGLVRQWIAG